MSEEGREAVPEEAPRDNVVAVAVRAERCLRVVDMEDSKALEADARVELASAASSVSASVTSTPEAHQ